MHAKDSPDRLSGIGFYHREFNSVTYKFHLFTISTKKVMKKTKVSDLFGSPGICYWTFLNNYILYNIICKPLWIIIQIYKYNSFIINNNINNFYLPGLIRSGGTLQFWILPKREYLIQGDTVTPYVTLTWKPSQYSFWCIPGKKSTEKYPHLLFIVTRFSVIWI